MPFNNIGCDLQLNIIQDFGIPLQQFGPHLLRRRGHARQRLPDLINIIHHTQQKLIILFTLLLCVLLLWDKLRHDLHSITPYQPLVLIRTVSRTCTVVTFRALVFAVCFGTDLAIWVGSSCRFRDYELVWGLAALLFNFWVVGLLGLH